MIENGTQKLVSPIFSLRRFKIKPTQAFRRSGKQPTQTDANQTISYV